MLWEQTDVIAKQKHLLELLPNAVAAAPPVPGQSLLTNN
jgi:hypothetical protein